MAELGTFFILLKVQSMDHKNYSVRQINKNKGEKEKRAKWRTIEHNLDFNY